MKLLFLNLSEKSIWSGEGIGETEIYKYISPFSSDFSYLASPVFSELLRFLRFFIRLGSFGYFDSTGSE